MGNREFELTLKSDPDLLPDVEQFIEDILKDSKVPDDKKNGLAVAVTEAATNAMSHGNNYDENKNIFVNVKENDKKFVVRVKDEGKGFDPAAVPDPTAPENLLKDSGRGLFIMRTYVDEVNFDFSPNGSELVLVLNLD